MQLGGPVMKDKLWFFGSFQYQKDADSQPGTDPAVPGAVVGQALLLEGELPAEPEQPLSGSDARRLLPHPGTRQRQHRAQHSRRGKRAQPVAGCAVDLGDQLDHRAGSALLGLLRRGSRRPAQRRSSRGAAIQRPRHRSDHRRHLLAGTTGRAPRPRSRARSPSTPTSSWAGATTSSSECSTTAAWVSTPTA